MITYNAVVYYGNIHEADSDARSFDTEAEAIAWVHKECQLEDTISGRVAEVQNGFTDRTVYTETGFFAD